MPRIPHPRMAQLHMNHTQAPHWGGGRRFFGAKGNVTGCYMSKMFCLRMLGTGFGGLCQMRFPPPVGAAEASLHGPPLRPPREAQRRRQRPGAAAPEHAGGPAAAERHCERLDHAWQADLSQTWSPFYKQNRGDTLVFRGGCCVCWLLLKGCLKKPLYFRVRPRFLGRQHRRKIKSKYCFNRARCLKDLY